MADLSVVVGPETKLLSDTVSASRTLSASASEAARVKDSIFGAGRTTGAGTPQMAGLEEGKLKASDTVSAAVYSQVPLRPQVIVEAELAGPGLWSNLGQGGSNDVVTAEGLVIRRGIQGGGPDDNVAGTGTLSFTLNNSAANSARLLGYYSLYHANKRAGWALDIGCRVRLVDPATATSRTRFVGKIDSIYPAAGQRGIRYVRVSAVDWMDDAARWNISADVGEQVGQRWDQILAAILARMPTNPTATSLEAGVEAYPYALDSSAFAAQPALAEFKKLADSERGLVYIRGDGTFAGEGRHTRLLNATSVWTIRDADMLGLTVPSSRDEVIDTIQVTIHPKIVDPLPTAIIYNQANVITIQPAASQLLLGSFRDEITGDPMGATDIQTLTPGVDWVANSAADGSGTDVTASFTVTVQKGPSGANFTVTNNTAAVGYLTALRLRGKGVKDKASLVLQSPSGSVGKHVVALDMPYQDNANVGQGAADYYLGRYNTAYAQARTASVPGKSAALLTQLLQREVSDRVTVQETVTGLNNDFFINGLEERILPSGHMQAMYTLSPAQDPLSGLYWVVGTSVLGVNTIPAPF